MNELRLAGIFNDDGNVPVLFCQLNQLVTAPYGFESWKERWRWIKFEEVVECNGKHWSKPYISLLNYQGINSVHKLFEEAIVLFDNSGQTLDEILSNALQIAIDGGKLNQSEKAAFIRILKISHTRPKTRYQGSSQGSVNSLFRWGSESTYHKNRIIDAETDEEPFIDTNFDSGFKRKIPSGSEVVNILVGEHDFLTENLFLFTRLKESLIIRTYSEVKLPSRFLVILFGPHGSSRKLCECGRVMGSIFADNIFRETIYKATTKIEIIKGIDEFMYSAFVIPPAEWDPHIRIEPPKEKVPSRKAVTQGNFSADEMNSDTDNENEEYSQFEIKRTKKFLGGLLNDIKRKSKFYTSDFRDALNVQCLATYAFLYFACLAPIITFGDLLKTATDGYLGAVESILAGAIAGLFYSLFAGQPLTILTTTGPLLVFEAVIYRLCMRLSLEYLHFRMWIGLWVMIILLIIVACDLNVLVKYITKFTEDCFAILISLIYIVKAFKSLFLMLENFPVNRYYHPTYVLKRTCACIPPNDTTIQKLGEGFNLGILTLQKPPLLNTSINFNDLSILLQNIDWSNISEGYFTWKTRSYKEMCVTYGGHWEGNTCGKLYVPDVFFLSWLLMLGTFITAIALNSFKRTIFLPDKIRESISNCAVIISITLFTLIDIGIGIHTPKLSVPHKFEPTLGYKLRNWYVPWLGKNPWWTIPCAFIPSILAVILVFMDHQITAIIINRKRNKLKKGHGNNLDMFIVAILIGVSSVMGLPWFVAGTVLSMNHVMSLKVVSSNNAPGDPPAYIGCREQRMTHFLISFTIGLSIFITPLLQRIPLPVLYGVFLYMGIGPLEETEFIQRIKLFFMSPRNRPDIKYLRFIPLRRVHLFTIIQIISLIALWTVTAVNVIAIGFPLILLFICFVRKAMECCFNEKELKLLDEPLPGSRSKNRKKKKKTEPV